MLTDFRNKKDSQSKPCTYALLKPDIRHTVQFLFIYCANFSDNVAPDNKDKY